MKGATIAGIASGAAVPLVATVLNIEEEKAKELIKEVKNFKAGAVRLRPGETYKTPAYALSLTRGVYLMNENGEQEYKACWSGAAHGSTIKYSVKNDWPWKNPDIFKLTD